MSRSVPVPGRAAPDRPSRIAGCAPAWSRRLAKLATLLVLRWSSLGGAEAIAAEGLPALPEGVRAVWDRDRAYRETTLTRERVSLNGLWLWQPATNLAPAAVPHHGWGYFKVPGPWPGITDYMQKDCQTVYTHADWAGTKLAAVSSAWYARDFAIPESWNGRRVSVRVAQLNSLAEVFVDGQRVGGLYFPGGELELPVSARTPGSHRLSLRVTALPLQGVLLSYTDSASAREMKGSVPRRGLCGDVWLISEPAGPRITGLRVTPSVRRHELVATVSLTGLRPDTTYRLRPQVRPVGEVAHEFPERELRVADLVDGHCSLTLPWMPERLWDIRTPGQQCDFEASLVGATNEFLDVAWPERFGFREFWIEGHDFYLNGLRLHLSAVPLDNAQVGAAWAGYAAAREAMERLQAFGINYVYTHNYGCEPGAHLAFDEILRAADDTGMLVGFSQPHFSHYTWNGADADRTNGYARHAEFYVAAAGNHPSVVMYAMSHNATGYNEDMNPDLIDGIHDARDTWAARNVKLAQRAEAIVRRLDPERLVYHHASGNLGPLHASNFYPNFAPIQELSDWFEHWATAGVKPLFTCEYGAPFTWDWTMYRGWYKGEREFGSARVPWEFCLAEWNAQFLGDSAYAISEPERANLRWEAAQLAKGGRWHRWDYPYPVGSHRFTERYPVFARYLTENWRAFRTWGVSANSPWEYEHFWIPRDGVDRRRRELPVDWDRLQRPGFSPDFIGDRYERVDLAYERNDWMATPAAEALIRNNRPLLAYLAGGPERFTSRAHVYRAGESVEKQIVVINDSRVPVTCASMWSLELPARVAGEREVRVAPGGQERIALRFALPEALPTGQYPLRLASRFDTGEVQEDTFVIDVLPRLEPAAPATAVRLFDPRGETTALFQRLGVPFETVTAATPVPVDSVLVIGKAALSVSGPAPDLRPVRNGLRVLVFEQTPSVLAERLGFRVVEYGLRDVFARVSDHPALAGLGAEHLHDWRGDATLLPPRLKYEMQPRRGPTVTWCGLSVPRVWRCGNQGNVASALIEKPARGNFLPILEGGFGLQYSPLLEYHEGRGLVLFCETDVTGRTDVEPAADRLVRNLVGYLASWQPSPHRPVVWAGAPEVSAFLSDAGIPSTPWSSSSSAANPLLVLGPGWDAGGPARGAELAAFLKGGGSLLALGFGPEDAALLPGAHASLTRREHMATTFPAPGRDSAFAGISPADVHNRDPRPLPLVDAGAARLGDGILANSTNGAVVYVQFVPWQFANSDQAHLRRTRRRAAFTVNRVLANLGAAGRVPLLEHAAQPPGAPEPPRWQESYYWDQPEEWDDPYRFFRW